METKPYGYSVKLRDDGKYDLSFLYEDCMFVHPHPFGTATVATSVGDMYKDFDFLRYHREGTEFVFYASDHTEDHGCVGETEEQAFHGLVEQVADQADPSDYGLDDDVDDETLYSAVEEALRRDKDVTVECVFVGDVLDFQCVNYIDEHYERVGDVIVSEYVDEVVDSVHDDWKDVGGRSHSEEAMMRCEMRRIYGDKAKANTQMYILISQCPPERFIKMEK